jgi:3,4-dihydroxyphenylacetate 2,3-dioxygenase
MGEIVAAAVLSHQPSIMAPEPFRVAIGGGTDTTLVPGFARVREALDRAHPDTFVIFDTHWFTTIEHIVAGAERYSGTYTSDELPTLLADVRYDFAGAPALAAAAASVGAEKGVRILNATNPHIAQHYPTLNMLHFLHHGEQVLVVGVCQTAEGHNFLDFGACLADAVRRTPGRVALLAAGGMSHAFWPMDVILEHSSYAPEHVISREARAFDERVLALWADGDHAAVIDGYRNYRRFCPEGHFGHYLMMVGALGGRVCRARGTKMSEYENAVGTGQVHVWFDLKERIHT